MLKSKGLYILREIKEVMYSLNQKINKDTKQTPEGVGVMAQEMNLASWLHILSISISYNKPTSNLNGLTQ